MQKRCTAFPTNILQGVGDPNRSTITCPSYIYQRKVYSEAFISKLVMSSTTSDEKADEIEPVLKEDSETADEAEEEISAARSRDEGHDRKRRKISSNEHARKVERERRMERYAKERIREMEPGPSRSASKRGDSRSSRRTNASGEHSRSRSEDRSRSNRSRSKSPAVGPVMPARVGKRLRRRPQRWEGERTEAPKSTKTVLGQATKAREVDAGGPVGRESDNESTVSAKSVHFDGECPALDNPVLEMKSGVNKCRSMMTRRAVVDYFHTWQLQAVSRQAAQQKALHVYLKRKLRRRTGRAPDTDRLEEEALRNARTATVKTGTSSGGGKKKKETFTALEDEAELIVPSKIRLPLEAYLPRRVKADKRVCPAEDIVLMARVKPHLPGSLSANMHERDAGREGWMRFPTVTTTSSLNKQRKVFQNGQK